MIYIHLIIVLIIIFLSINNNQILREKLDNVISNKNSYKVKILFFIINLLIYLIAYKISKNNKIHLVIIILLFILIVTEIKLIPRCKIDDIVEVNDIVDDLNTGDIILFRAFKSNDITDFFIFRLFASLLTNNFSHVGIVVKINNKSYIMECSQEYLHCSYSNIIKNGTVIAEPSKRLNEYYGNIYIIKNNLHNYIDNNSILPFFEKYKNCKYLEDLLVCTTFVNKFLYKNNITKKNSKIILPSYFIDKNLYNIDYKIYKIYKIKSIYNN